MLNEIYIWGGFGVIIFALLTLDLKVFHRNPHEVKIKEALIFSAFWIGVSIAFNIGVYLWKGREPALQFFAGYLIEESLSVDNLFVFLVIFNYFQVPARYQHRVLFWGIVGALLMRGMFIFLGVSLIREFHWILYIFGVILVFTGVRMMFQKEAIEIHPEKNIVVRIFKKFFGVTPGYHTEKFFVKTNSGRYATLLFVVLLVIETTDLVFATDSIPAVFAISRDPFIIYTSNVFAILGLRSLYFALAGLMDLFYYLRYGLSIVLSFIGLKMLASYFIDIHISIALGVVAGVLAVSIIASVIRSRRLKRRAKASD